MALRLWGTMMVLVLLAVAFMWAIQIFMLEKNYANATIHEVQEQLNPIMEDLKTEDLAYDAKLIPYLSKSINGKMLLVSNQGEPIEMYSYGHPINLQEAHTESLVWQGIKASGEYQKILAGEPYNKEIRYEGRLNAYEIGIPVVYYGQQAYVILFRSFGELYTVLEMNREQLIVLSIILSIATAILAGILSLRFTRPILVIKNTVDRLAKGDLAATPGLKLKDELGQLSGSVEELGRALQRVDLLRKEIIANVSHELRSPLALINGYAEMVRDIHYKDDIKREEDLNLIIKEAGRMSEMVNDIMDYSQLQAGYLQLSKDWYNLHEIIESEIEHCEQSAAEHQSKITLESPEAEIPVLVDALKISQVLRNLLYNAINHTKDGGSIVVAITGLDRSYKISVINQGEPIPVEEREAIWERYQRSQHQAGRRQGTGIGLSIVSTILKAHDMPYGVDCADGNTAFWFICPTTQRN
ncbi:HAMP domain-containing protein [Paenibacillus sp. LMG 31459]|uniref:histidine kinase n=2 Tax=Paenibacillus phytohabitans TaxID=2654978 RepID=A0ABX1Y9C8_9BACL|nr:HAMP domain-containing protein [Paenibacillus phytohabitans]